MMGKSSEEVISQTCVELEVGLAEAEEATASVLMLLLSDTAVPGSMVEAKSGIMALSIVLFCNVNGMLDSRAYRSVAIQTGLLERQTASD